MEGKLCDLRLVRGYSLGLGGLVGFDFAFVFTVLSYPKGTLVENVNWQFYQISRLRWIDFLHVMLPIGLNVKYYMCWAPIFFKLSTRVENSIFTLLLKCHDHHL